MVGFKSPWKKLVEKIKRIQSVPFTQTIVLGAEVRLQFLADGFYGLHIC